MPTGDYRWRHKAKIAFCTEKLKGDRDGYYGKMWLQAKSVDAYGVPVVGIVGVIFEAVVSNLKIKG